jgi:hypothetical protein
MLFTSHNTPHINLGNEFGVCNTKKLGDLSIPLENPFRLFLLTK